MDMDKPDPRSRRRRKRSTSHHQTGRISPARKTSKENNHEELRQRSPKRSSSSHSRGASQHRHTDMPSVGTHSESLRSISAPADGIHARKRRHHQRRQAAPGDKGPLPANDKGSDGGATEVVAPAAATVSSVVVEVVGPAAATMSSVVVAKGSPDDERDPVEWDDQGWDQDEEDEEPLQLFDRGPAHAGADHQPATHSHLKRVSRALEADAIRVGELRTNNSIKERRRQKSMSEATNASLLLYQASRERRALSQAQTCAVPTSLSSSPGPSKQLQNAAAAEVPTGNQRWAQLRSCAAGGWAGGGSDLAEEEGELAEARLLLKEQRGTDLFSAIAAAQALAARRAKAEVDGQARAESTEEIHPRLAAAMVEADRSAGDAMLSFRQAMDASEGSTHAEVIGQKY